MKPILILILILVATSGKTSRLWAVPPPVGGQPAAKTHEPIKPIPFQTNLDSRKVALGRMLFQESKLSHDNTVSCASCHDLSQAGTDHRVHSFGIHQTEGTINAPTVFNSAGNFKQFWDGRAATLEEQIDGPIQAPGEMGSTWDEVIGKLRATPVYNAPFKAIYPNGIQRRNIKDAIAQFERSLITPNARFDKFLRGDDTALTTEEKEGYRKFKSYGCTSCHQGVNVGGNMFETLGAMADYFADRGGPTPADNGRFNVTGREDDRYVFKVPSLRNVARTAPYLHDGSAKTLEEAVTVMGRYQLGERLSPQDVDQIVKFLKTLTGEYEGKPL
ncbi:Cytochrome-c peroxidase [Chthoniobacter flavus Ellin428]|uniref:Cytochrome-c peroxidase n=1 Tax=Chthoniobacter flavus Ellin428 TaxID=497964 RepID=B4D265_9BACT|nr:cytochrome-c peroxidase [Chthoniobacter flavus]EDY19305.1 Cytochrome-c peroxidase [Chthoniobacter flavus Ellin428]TCO90563.1 cytochrome c peroxidase [Chthoniobacter flavus]